jgi:hypothetical protein
MASVGAGVARVGLPAVRRSSGEVRAVGGGGLVRETGVGRSGSFKGAMGNRFRGSAWVEDVRRVGLDVGLVRRC